MPGLVSPRQFGTDAYSIARLPYETNNLSLNLRTPNSSSEEPSEPSTRTTSNQPGTQSKGTGNFWSNALHTAERVGTGVGATALGIGGAGYGLAKT